MTSSCFQTEGNQGQNHMGAGGDSCAGLSSVNHYIANGLMTSCFSISKRKAVKMWGSECQLNYF